MDHLHPQLIGKAIEILGGRENRESLPEVIHCFQLQDLGNLAQRVYTPRPPRVAEIARLDAVEECCHYRLEALPAWPRVIAPRPF